MRTKFVTALFVISVISICSATIIAQSAISSILQDIMSPANTEKAMQLINMASQRTNKNIAVPTTVITGNDSRLPRINEFPVTRVVSGEYIFARNDPVRIGNDMGLPKVLVTNDGTRLVTSESAVLRPEFTYSAPQKFRQVVRETPANAANMIDLRQISQAVPVALPQENIGYPCRASVSEPYLPVYTPSNPYLSVTRPTNSYLPVAPAPSSNLPVSALNPYLPASIPNPFQSGAPPLFPSFLPPPIQSKGQFLRKIPIPPPML